MVLGAGGAFLELDDRYPLSTPLHLRFESDTLGTIGCRAIVRRVIEGKGVTVEFLDIEPGDRERITTFVEKHRATAQPRQ